MEAVARLAATNSRWQTMVHAAIRTAGSSVVSALLTALSTKIIAAVGGPSAVGFLSTLQQTRQTGLVAASLNGQTALIQGLSARSAAPGLYLRTVLVLMGGATAIVTASMMLLPDVWSKAVGLSDPRVIPWLALVVILSTLFVVLCAILNAAHEIGRLALVQIASPFAMSLLAYPAAAWVATDRRWLVWALAAGSVLAVSAGVVALWERRHEIASGLSAMPLFDALCARAFLRVAATMFVTGFLGSAALLAVRQRIQAEQGLAITGQFDAAWGISMNQVTLVLASMQTYFLPALAKAEDPRERSSYIGQGLVLAAVTVAPVAATIAVFKPAIVAFLFSGAFTATPDFLRWTLLGDYLKVASWILSVPLLAAADMRAFLWADLAAYGTFVAASGIFNLWLTAAEAAACGFLAMYAAHLAVCGVLSWRRHGIRIPATNACVWLAGFAGLLAVTAATWEAR